MQYNIRYANTQMKENCQKLSDDRFPIIDCSNIHGYVYDFFASNKALKIQYSKRRFITRYNKVIFKKQCLKLRYLLACYA